MEIHEKILGEVDGDIGDFGDLLGGGFDFGMGGKKGKKGKSKGNAGLGNLESMMFDMMGGNLDMNMNDFGFGGNGGKKKKGGKKK